MVAIPPPVRYMMLFMIHTISISTQPRLRWHRKSKTQSQSTRGWFPRDGYSSINTLCSALGQRRIRVKTSHTHGILHTLGWIELYYIVLDMFRDVHSTILQGMYDTPWERMALLCPIFSTSWSKRSPSDSKYLIIYFQMHIGLGNTRGPLDKFFDYLNFRKQGLARVTNLQWNSAWKHIRKIMPGGKYVSVLFFRKTAWLPCNGHGNFSWRSRFTVPR